MTVIENIYYKNQSAANEIIEYFVLKATPWQRIIAISQFGENASKLVCIGPALPNAHKWGHVSRCLYSVYHHSRNAS